MRRGLRSRASRSNVADILSASRSNVADVLSASRSLVQEMKDFLALQWRSVPRTQLCRVLDLTYKEVEKFLKKGNCEERALEKITEFYQANSRMPDFSRAKSFAYQMPDTRFLIIGPFSSRDYTNKVVNITIVVPEVKRSLIVFIENPAKRLFYDRPDKQIMVGENLVNVWSNRRYVDDFYVRCCKTSVKVLVYIE